MAIHDFKSQRLYCNAAKMQAGNHVLCTPGQANYLLNVLRLSDGDGILTFNGHDGEWRAQIRRQGKRKCSLELIAQIRPQTSGPDIHYLFAPLKRERLDYMVQKATELGVSVLHPVYTQHTVAERVNLERMRANVIEAAEQCGILRLPEVEPPEKLMTRLRSWDADRSLIFADESADVASPSKALETIGHSKLAVLIGPEGGFSETERNFLIQQPYVQRISLGPRIMRADTAAVAVLALVNAVLGDW